MRKRSLILCIVTLLIFMSMSCGKQAVQDEDEQESVQIQGMATELTIENVENTAAPNVDICMTNQEETECMNCIVQIQTDRQRGSGVLWDKQEDFWYFVTAAHVVEGLEQAEVYFVEKDRMCSAQVYCVKGLDLAFLQVEAGLFEEQMTANYVECKENSVDVKSGDNISTVGYNASAEKLEYVGSVWEPWIYIEDFANYMLMCQCEAQAGMSGGAVFTTAGELAGIICGQNEAGMLAALPVMVIESEYNLFMNY